MISAVPLASLALAGSTPEFFTQVTILLVAGAVIAYLGSRLKLLPIVGFLLAGVVIGPNALGLVEDRELVDAAAEVGVVLLLFTIGIEFSFEKLNRIRRLIFGAGGLQVVLATGVTAGILAMMGVGWRVGIFSGFLVALSSTAIVLKLLGDRGESATEHGQVGLGLLIFQDLAIIPMVLLVPILGGQGGPPQDIAFALLRAAGIIAVVLLVARRVMPVVLDVVARTCSPEIFLLTVVAVCFGTAYLTSLAGVSLSLGAFLAGLLVSESRFSEHALGEILPLQILFSATFFVSVGMLTDPAFILRNPLIVLAVVAGVLLVKFVTTVVSVRALGYRLPVAAASGLILAQVGEFSFVLERAGRDAGLSPMGLGETGSQAFVATTVLLMILTPALAALGTRLEGKMDTMGVRKVEEDVDASHLPHLDGHVVVAGYGDAARRLVRVLRIARIPHVVTTLSPEGANEADADGTPVLRGDSARSRTLQLVGAERARVMVIADDEPAMALRIATVARSLNPELRIVVRTRYAADAPTLAGAGANHVVAEETEAIVRLSADVLRELGIAPGEVEAHEASLRAPARTPPPAAPSKPPTAADTIDPEEVITFVPTDPAICKHLGAVRPVHPSARGCEECLRIGSRWVHLRICMTCGHVGCCDSSPNRHADRHFHGTRHPVMRSVEPGERWGWCYEDEVTLLE